MAICSDRAGRLGANDLVEIMEPPGRFSPQRQRQSEVGQEGGRARMLGSD